ncbi:MAG: hypothetical protein OHK93_001566 [Ramalina farinacea]|uniref:Uncharacterized protein n=1 Tax=Ramalina farinacea TaxID=258253 RepID=A0AA43TT00_9LECA|nr:hypothetical protein [Ramalina farinacea]
MLLSGIARQIGDWAVRSDANLDTLWEALDRGNVGLLDLGAQVARLSVQDVRALHRDKIEAVKPMAERIPRDINAPGVERYPITIPEFRATPEVCVFNHVIYSELFHHDLDRILGRGGDQLMPLSDKTGSSQTLTESIRWEAQRIVKMQQKIRLISAI